MREKIVQRARKEDQMRRAVLVTIIVIAVIVAVVGVWFGLSYAFGRGSGPIVTEQRDVEAFSQIEVSGKGELHIAVGDTPQLRIEAQQSVLDRLDTRVTGDTLQIGERWSWLGPPSLWLREPVIYYLTVRTLASMKLSGSMTVLGEDSIDTSGFRLTVSGTCDLDLDVQTTDLMVETSGTANITLRGNTDSAWYATSGAIEILARDLASRSVTIDCSGTSNIVVNTSERLTVHASGSSTISYVGDPATDQEISGTGEVRRLEE